MLNKKITGILISIITSVTALAQDANTRYLDYIEQWAETAIEQQEEWGIPASITLAQGLLESAAGRSTLASKGNNHFGIKCHADWEGDTMLRDDDAPDECFRVYNTPEESFHDHSRFLSRKRYRSLFELLPDDYEGWAHGLSKCGYATDPQYAVRLISIIERYSLYLYDSGTISPADDAVFILRTLQSIHAVRRSRGLHYVIANPGDTYGTIAREFNVNISKLLEFNDAERDGEIREWQEVYLEEKLTTAPDGMRTVTIGEEETMHSVAQRFGMRLSTLRNLNPDAHDKPGTRLRLK